MRKTPAFSLFLTLTLAICLQVCYSDLPIHCLRSQAAGEWKLAISEPMRVPRPFRMNCGHEAPDAQDNSYLALRNKFKPKTEFMAELRENDKVYSKGDVKGSWTMIYDEGLDIVLDGHRFTSFFDYFPDKDGKVLNNCGKTVVGWYKNLLSGEMACFRGEKIFTTNSEQLALLVRPLTPTQLPTAFLQANLKSKDSKFLKSSTNMIVNQKAIVDKLNQRADKLWTAKVYPRFEGKTMKELNALAGRRKGISFESFPSEYLIQTVDVSDLPKQFSWKDAIHEARDQGGCGSCFAVASIGMLEARLKIKYQKDVRLSVQHLLDCSMENQGCDGGFAFLVGMFGNNHEFVPESCSPYLDKKGSCSKCDISKLNELYKVKEYGYVGGAYARGNERNIMQELMNNGPLVASLKTESEFMYYSGGVYKSIGAADLVALGLQQPEWEALDHSILLYGWGETDDGVKYWILQNSWGADWGENGSFRILRGTDENSIESAAEYANPYIVKQN